MVSDHIMRTLKVLEILNFSSFHEEYSIKLWEQSIQILEQSLSYKLYLLLVTFRDTEKIKPKSVGTGKSKTLQVECF